MEVTKILRELGEAELLPEDALKAAVEQRNEVTPVFLNILEEMAAGNDPADGERSPLLLLLHLLAEFGEKKAFPSLIKFLHQDSEHVEYHLGDATTEMLPRVLISLFDGNVELLKNLILDSKVDEFVRYAGLEAMAYLTRVGEIERQDTERFLRDCHYEFPQENEDHVWVGWQSAIALLGLESLSEPVEKAFLAGWISRWQMSFHDFETDLNFTLEDPDSMALFDRMRLRPFKSVTEEFSGWYGFSEEYWKEVHEEDDAPLAFPPQNEPRSNLFRNVGRNAPCPCGSGKKYKKCCLN